MRDKSPAPHFKHILSEREEHFHEDTAAASSREAAAQRQDYDITLHHFESYHECMQQFISGLITTLIVREYISGL